MMEEEVTINLTLHPANSEKIEVKQVALGLSPAVVIEGVLGSDGEPELNVSASGLTRDELQGVLELVVEALEGPEGEEVW